MPASGRALKLVATQCGVTTIQHDDSLSVDPVYRGRDIENKARASSTASPLCIVAGSSR
jgi:hypothetical protein